MNKTFGELSIDEKLELHRAMYEGKPVQYWVDDHERWETKCTSQFHDNLVYRIAPEPETDIELPWHVISPEYRWAARDESGDIYVYESEPFVSNALRLWVGDDAKYCNHLIHLIHKPGNKPWDQSLIKRPEGV